MCDNDPIKAAALAALAPNMTIEHTSAGESGRLVVARDPMANLSALLFTSPDTDAPENSDRFFQSEYDVLRIENEYYKAKIAFPDESERSHWLAALNPYFESE